MATEPAYRDPNGVNTLLGVDPTVAAGDKKEDNIRRLNTKVVTIGADTFNALVTTSDASGGSGGSQFSEADTYDGTDLGNLSIVTDGTNYFIARSNASGNLDIVGTVAISGTVNADSTLQAGSNLVGKVQLRNPGDTVDLGDATNPVRTNPTGTTAQPVTDDGGSLTVDDGGTPLDVDVQSLPPLPTGTNNIGDVDVLTLPSLPSGTNNIGDVDVLSLPSLPAGTNNIGDVDIASALPAGTNNIGDVDVASLPSIPAGTNNIGDVDIASALPAGTNTIGEVVTQPVDDSDGLVATATLSSATTNQEIISVGVSETLVVLSLAITNGDASMRQIELYEEGDAATPQFVSYLAANGGGVTIEFPGGWTFGSAGDDLDGNLDAVPGSNDVQIVVHYKLKT